VGAVACWRLLLLLLPLLLLLLPLLLLLLPQLPLLLPLLLPLPLLLGGSATAVLLATGWHCQPVSSWSVHVRSCRRWRQMHMQ
jgi:hypothetical protein